MPFPSCAVCCEPRRRPERTLRRGRREPRAKLVSLAWLRARIGRTRSSIWGVKVSVSLPEADVDYLDAYAESEGLESRSAAVQQAVRLLRVSGLGPAYEDAWTEWSESGDAELWDEPSADGLG